MQIISDTTTSVTVRLTLKEASATIAGHLGYSIQIITPTQDVLHPLTVTTENDRITVAAFTLSSALPANDYLFRVYSMDTADSSSVSDRIEEVERGILRVTETDNVYSAYETNPRPFKEYTP